MRKTSLLLIALAAWSAALPVPVLPAQDAHSVRMRLKVKEKFHVRIDCDDIDFGDVHQGDKSRREHLHFYATTNHGVEWAIQIQGEPLRHEDGHSTVPRDDFRYVLTQTPGHGGHPGESRPVPGAMTTIYTADPSHFVTENAPFGLGFDVNVPHNQKSGRYNSTLTIRMVDNL
jgi:hypothetical protein